ncbi:hypothetical protein Ddc_18057 [Ditylenchus destructor]|nr:hypothetical protein Ddc_18057 [Ditylenchus destructor]
MATLRLSFLVLTIWLLASPMVLSVPFGAGWGGGYPTSEKPQSTSEKPQSTSEKTVDFRETIDAFREATKYHRVPVSLDFRETTVNF